MEAISIRTGLGVLQRVLGCGGVLGGGVVWGVGFFFFFFWVGGVGGGGVCFLGFFFYIRSRYELVFRSTFRLPLVDGNAPLSLFRRLVRASRRQYCPAFFYKHGSGLLDIPPIRSFHFSSPGGPLILGLALRPVSRDDSRSSAFPVCTTHLCPP